MFFNTNPEIHKTFNLTVYDLDTTKIDDKISFCQFLTDNKNNPSKNLKSKGRDYVKNRLPRRKERTLNPTLLPLLQAPIKKQKAVNGEFQCSRENYERLRNAFDFDGQNVREMVMKIIMLSDTDKIWERLQRFLGLNLASHKDTLTKTSSLLDAFWPGKLKNLHYKVPQCFKYMHTCSILSECFNKKK